MNQLGFKLISSRIDQQGCELTPKPSSIENVNKQLVQLIVLVSMLPTVPGMLVLVEYSNDEIRPMVATPLTALDCWFSGRPALSLIHI